MSKTALNRTSVQLLTNKSGGGVAQGDVVVIDTGTASSFATTAVEGYVAQQIGVVVEPNGIANNATGLIATGGYVSLVNLDGAAALGDFIKTDGVVKQGTPHATPSVEGDFAQALIVGATPEAILFGAPNWATGGGGGGGYTEGARVYNDANINVNNVTNTNLTFNTERWDTDNIHDIGVNPDRLTCRTAGKYLIIVGIQWEANANGANRQITIKLNGATSLARIRTLPSLTLIYETVSTVYDLSVSEYVIAEVYQDSGGALNVEVGSNISPEFSMQRIG